MDKPVQLQTTLDDIDTLYTATGAKGHQRTKATVDARQLEKLLIDHASMYSRLKQLDLVVAQENVVVKKKRTRFKL